MTTIHSDLQAETGWPVFSSKAHGRLAHVIHPNLERTLCGKHHLPFERMIEGEVDTDTAHCKGCEYLMPFICPADAGVIHRCDWDGCNRHRELGMLYCATHLGMEIDRWLDES